MPSKETSSFLAQQEDFEVVDCGYHRKILQKIVGRRVFLKGIGLFGLLTMTAACGLPTRRDASAPASSTPAVTKTPENTAVQKQPTPPAGSIKGELEKIFGTPTTTPEGFVDMRFYRDENAPLLKKAIEDQFNTELMTRGEMWEQTYGGRLIDGHPDLEAKWDTPTLEMLKQYLLLLPQHFYQKKEDGRRIRIVLSTFPSSSDCYPFGFASENDPCEVTVRHEVFNPNNKRDAFRLLAHESIHAVTPASVQNPGAKRPEWAFISPWYDKIDTIMGYRSNDVRQRLYLEVQGKRMLLGSETTDLARDLNIDQNLTKEDEKELFYRRFEYGLGYLPGGRGVSIYKDGSPNEFIAVLGEHYIHGKEFFSRMYGEFFPQEVVEKLYNFVKGDVFRGKEYKSFPVQ